MYQYGVRIEFVIYLKKMQHLHDCKKELYETNFKKI